MRQNSNTKKYIKKRKKWDTTQILERKKLRSVNTQNLNLWQNSNCEKKNSGSNYDKTQKLNL